MTDPKAILDKALALIDHHLEQLKNDSTQPNEKGVLKGLSQYDAGVIDKYAKILITLTKKEPDGLENLSEAELEAIVNGQDNAPDEMGDAE